MMLLRQDVVKKITVFLSGALGICAQVFVLRVLVAACGVNELFMGAMLGVWVLAEGAGVIAADLVWGKLKNKCWVSPGDFFAISVIMSGIFLMVAVWIAPLARVVFGWDLGIMVGFGGVLLAMLVFGGPVAFFHGAAFVGACCVVLGGAGGRRSDEIGAASGGTAYVWETAGTLSGGVLVTALFLLTPGGAVTPSRLLAAAATISGVAGLLAALTTTSTAPRRPILLAAAIPPALLALVATHILPAPHFPLPPQSHHIKTAITPYSTITLTKTSPLLPFSNAPATTSLEAQTQYTIYSDGKPILAMPYGDLEFAEEIARYTTLLLLPQPPRYMALIGSSARTILEKIYQDTSLKKIDLIEPDIVLLNMIKEVPLPTSKNVLSTLPEVSFIKSDPLYFFKKHLPAHKYDIIILNSPLPTTLLENRLYTEEFFHIIYNALSDEKESILSFHITGSDTYITPEIARLNASIISSAARVFKKHEIYVLPATGGFTQTNIYFCIKNSSAPPLLPTTDEEKIIPAPPDIHRITQNLKNFTVHSPVVSPDYLAARFSPINRRTYKDSLKDVPDATPNTLLKPITCYYATLFESRQYAPKLFSLLKISSHILTPRRSIYLSIFLFLLAITFFLIKKTTSAAPHYLIYINMFSVGFSSMTFTLLLMFIFQSVHGYIYGFIGLLTAAFMCGSTFGAALATKRLSRLSDQAQFRNYLSSPHFLLGMLNLISSFTLKFFHSTIPPAVFIFVLILCGFLSGVPYPISLKFLETFQSDGRNMSRSKLYVAELIGGFIGGATAGIILLPLIGAPLSFLLISSVEILVASLLMRAFVPRRI